MKARGALVQGALALAGLTAAYFTWQRGPEESSTEVVVLDERKAALGRIRYQTETRWLELEREHQAPTPVVWIRTGPVEQQHPAPLADAGQPNAGSRDAGAATSPAPPPAPEPPRELRGNERAERLYERFAPLRASRALGVLSPEKLKELYLDSTRRRLEVVTAGGTRGFKVSTSPMGVAPYALDETDGKVYLLHSSLLSEMDPLSQQLVDRRLHAFRPVEFDALVLKVGERQRELVQAGADSPQGARLAPKATPEKPDELAKNWHDKVWGRLVVSEVLSRGEKPKSGEPKLALRIDYLSGGKPKGFLELAQGEKNEVWARSEHTASWALLYPGGEEVLAEAKKVAGGD